MADSFDQDDLFDEDENLDGEGSGDAQATGDDAPPSDQDASSDESNPETRINGLMSKWQKAEARAEKLEKRLAALEKPTRGTEAPKTRSTARVPDDVKVWLDTAKEAAQARIYEQDPRFKEYGIDRSQIQGRTPQEMVDAASRYTKMIDGIESRMRNTLMAEYGIEAAATGVNAGKAVDFNSMSKEEFEKWVERGRTG
jgi:hypothetical protein